MDDFPRIIEKTAENAANPRILIVRLSAIGDCIQTMPLACAVRDHWPTAHITWVTEKVSAPLVEACSAVDRVVVVPKGFATTWKLLRRLRRVLTTSTFDFALDPQGLTKSGLVAWLSSVQRRIGFARPASRELNPFLQTERVRSVATHRVNRYLELLRPLGSAENAVRFGLNLPAAAATTAQKLADQHKLHAGYAVLNPGAGWDSKRWPVERFSHVARHLAARGIPSLVVWAGSQEQAWAEEIVKQAAGGAHLAPQTSLLELAAVLERAQLFVSSDTGPLHLAAAVGTPCVALFGASRGDACGPYGRGHQVLQVALDESPGRKRPGANNWAMRAIGPQAVCNACDALLAASPTRIARPLAA